MHSLVINSARIARIVGGLLAILAYDAAAELDLRNATVDRLANGLTVVILEDRSFPVASTQMLYRVGARNETTGKTGLAHFVEHMAFRDSTSFPDTALVGSIYAVGGEWHGYTWTDQTTYFSTVPKEHLDLLLRIEADRMSQLLISPDDMDAERGAVLAEMHMYENSPTSMLVDAVMFTSFLAHPYRNNTIGWESDIANLQHRDVVSFYDTHYHPANAVLAVVGDIDRRRTLVRITELFGGLPHHEPTPLPVTVEPAQNGERRIMLHGAAQEKQFMIGYRAPSANHPDYPAFLVLQEILGGSSGANFLQNDWGTPVRDDSLLHGAARDVTTWFPPSAQDYIFIIGGKAPSGAGESDVEQEVEKRVETARNHMPHSSVLALAIERTRNELVYDVETTEDAAHQLAFFSGLDALGSLLTLDRRIGAVTASDVQRVASRWLKPTGRTIAWHLPAGEEARVEYDVVDSVAPEPADEVARSPGNSNPAPPPELRRLRGGIPAVVQSSDVSSSVYVQIVFRGNAIEAENIEQNTPAAGFSSIRLRGRPAELEALIERIRVATSNATIRVETGEVVSFDPEYRLEQAFEAQMSVRDAQTVAPAVIVVSGKVPADTFDMLQAAFGELAPHNEIAREQPRKQTGEQVINLGTKLSQAQLGYLTRAPRPSDPSYGATRILQYIFAHDYEGRLGKEAISNRGLAYYIDSRYRSDGNDGWITLGIGVDPQKIGTLKSLLLNELQRLESDAPGEREINEAKSYFQGRARSAAQSNEELADALARHWLWHGNIAIGDTVDRKIAGVTRKDVLEAIPGFIDGMTIVVTE